MEKTILGLDLGTNSIGWALVTQDAANAVGKIKGMGSRIIPMSQDILGEFDKGNSISQTAERTRLRSVRRLRERQLLRRERLLRVLNCINFLPSHFSKAIDFEVHYGQFKKNTEPKITYQEDGSFLFMQSFQEMLHDFSLHQPEILQNNRKIPYDWTIYYLRKKALTQKIEKEELAWLLLHFNQKRGYYQLRGEEDDESNSNKKVEYHTLPVIEVTVDEPIKGKSELWYNVKFENGWIYRRSSKTPLFDWEGKLKEFIVTTDLNADGSTKTKKDGMESRSFKAVNSEEDWIAIKKSTEVKIEKSEKTVGQYIYDTLLANPSQKINGKLVRTIERKYYKSELETILRKQQEFHQELQNEKLYKAAILELYRQNEEHIANIKHRDFVYLFLQDIIFYQRPLRSKKSQISNCRFETRSYLLNGVQKTEALKCIPKSNPYFQEFRLWQWIYNLRIYERETDQDISTNLLSHPDKITALFDFLNNRKDIDQKNLLKHFKLNERDHRWNYVEDKKYPCNETRSEIKKRLSEVAGIAEDFLSNDIELRIWHILYSVEDKEEIKSALKKFADRFALPEGFCSIFEKFPRFEKEYGAYSEKAIKKLLPLVRTGKYWDKSNISANTLERIDLLLTGEYNENIKELVRKKTLHLQTLDDFQGLPLWLASYIVYDAHAEDLESAKWRTPNDLATFLKEFKQHSLRNPIVEQIITETLRVVHDIWTQFGMSKENFFNEIHIELGRELKNPADKRANMSKRNTENENSNLRIKALLAELFNDSNFENVRPYSPMQQEILKIYEEGVLNSGIEIPDEILKISKLPEPSKSELAKYKLWLNQKYRSPYTGSIIPLNKLFTPAFEIEHIIPQSRFFDDSFSNKVICESEVNKLKDNQLGLEFIKNHHGQKVELAGRKTVQILSEEEFTDLVKDIYKNDNQKKNKLLLEDIPEKMIERQLNDTRYISKYVKNLLSNIVREEKDDDGTTSKNLIPCSGQITSALKNDWGLNEIWNELITPRFQRLNELTGSNEFGQINPNTGKFLPTVPLHLSKGFSKKRIDHRHHALDALVIACTSRNHVNFFNNQHALDRTRTKNEKQKSREDLRATLCFKHKTDSQGNYQWRFNKPWAEFTQQARERLQTIIVSFKQNLRVINKSVNYYQAWSVQNGQKIKTTIKQTKGDNWAIRKSLHKDTVSGSVQLKFKKPVSLSNAIEQPDFIVNKGLKLKVKKLLKDGLDKKKILAYFKTTNNQYLDQDISRPEIYYWDSSNVASRVSINESFDSNYIKCITDTGIQKILLRHLAQFNEEKNGKIIEHPELAFSPEGLEKMNENIIQLNGGKFHKPILKVRTFEPMGNKFAVGHTGTKNKKFVEADKGTNLFFGIYFDAESNKRFYETIPLQDVIERLKKGLPAVPEFNNAGVPLLFFLSPNELVSSDGSEINTNISKTEKDPISIEFSGKVYKVVSFSGSQCFFIRHDVSSSIVNKIEFSALNKMERSIEGIMIKQFCNKIKIDRLGNFVSTQR